MTTVGKTYRDKLKGVRIPLPKQKGGPHKPKDLYKRKPRTAKRDEFNPEDDELNYEGNPSERL
jgi:hypothetical protein